ncbi:SusC/RagA family TonB-linked outer membrane protein [Capnocytophaga canimorsus]|uniref:SusC/RagA family TonB-linked outer membrane protein n=1 Tax=Capnocytophaga canimorsus TaxID=28188 RepID=UPI001AC1BED6|nr:SusC/RagA family TonB-linked outer membrane protein [Capnocytophaga canimorsus]GIM57678.1 SusC/RagA family TonB-linked outer membrane protein [Capnocytophaga canimorsus]
MKNFIYVIFVVFVFFSTPSYSQQQRSISGKVVSDSNKEPLLGASVFISSQKDKKVTDGVTTDFDGNFKITIPEGIKKISVSFIGYKTKDVILTSKNYYEIILDEEVNTLGEVILTGYQKIEARKLTASVAKLKTENIMQTGVASIDQLITGQVAGLESTISTGAPGEIAKIRIRGTSSLQGNQDPLWVIDGLPLADNEAPNLSNTQNALSSLSNDSLDELRNYSIAGINPEDIEDVTILKDAAATAIYGARAANGVIVITTKKGKQGSMRINLSSNTFLGLTPNFKNLNLMNSSEKVDFELTLAKRKDLEDVTNLNNAGSVYRILNETNELVNYQNGDFSSLSLSTQNKINALRNNNLNWNKLLYRNTLNKQYTISISGGNQKSDYYFSVGYFDEEGTTFGTGFKRYTLTLNNSYHISDRLKTSVSVLGNQNNRKTYLTETGLFTNPAYYIRTVNPYLSAFDNEGNYFYDKDVEGLRIGIDREFIDFNTIEERNNTSYDLTNLSLKSIFDLEYKIAKGFAFSSQFGIQIDRENSERYATKNSYYNRNYKNKSLDSSSGVAKFFMPEGDIKINDETKFFQYNWKSTIQYGVKFNNSHEFDILIGSEFRRDNYLKINKKEFGYNAQNMSYLPIVYPTPERAGSDTYFRNAKNIDRENAYTSFYGTSSYTYKNRYSIFASLRYDGSNLFGVDPKYKYLPLWAISGAWIVSEENFLKDNKIISFLKLRGSYGFQGNIDKTTSPFIVGQYTTNAFLNNSANQETIEIINLPNAKLRWETTENYDSGIDIGFLNNRIRIGGEFYKRISTDLLGVRNLPLENGFTSAKINWAKITNTGYGLILQSQNIKNKQFQWSTVFTLSKNSNVVNREEVDRNSIRPSLEGYPINALFVIKTDGLDAKGLPIFVDKEGNKISDPVTYFKLFKGYGGAVGSSLSAKEMQNLFTYVGNKSPKFTGGFNNTFRYKNLSLNVNTYFTIQQMVQRRPPYNFVSIDRGRNYSREIFQVWTPENTNTHLPRIVGATTDSSPDYALFYGWLRRGNHLNLMSNMDIWTKKISYLRISNIGLGYSFPEQVTKKIGMTSLRLNIEGRNLLVFSTDYTGYFDPETYGFDYTQPIAKSVSIGLNASF